MLQQIKDLQQRAVSELMHKLSGTQRVLTFRAPTGSGKTHMMADLMNRILQKEKEVVFIVSSLSKGDLARQNYLAFRQRADSNIFPNLNPYLISTNIGDEEGLFIPTNYNVYVLPRDLSKRNGLLMAGPMIAFLSTLTNGKLFNSQSSEESCPTGLGKHIYLIKDECHQATKNIDALSDRFFSKVINLSATPNLKRGQNPDVQITDEEAEQSKLIKHIVFGGENDTLADALDKYKQIKKQYSSLGVNPCLIIQISNKERADQQWQQDIRPLLKSVPYQHLKWMFIVDDNKQCDTNDDLKKYPVNKWKEYAKLPNATIDIIIFKMVITEGWDIPRACMLYQVRDSQSKQLDEQVMGRVRRNPRLLDFETLPPEQQHLATTAWVWGIKPESMRHSYKVSLFDKDSVKENLQLKTIRLTNLSQRKDFDVSQLIGQPVRGVGYESIFSLYQRLRDSDTDLQNLCYQYADGDVNRWRHFMDNFPKIKKHFNQYICDYEQSMEVSEATSFPIQSYYLDNGNNTELDDWVWCKLGSSSTFSFDSEAERRWAALLHKHASQYAASLHPSSLKNDVIRYLWGKNFLPNSDIRYEYYDAGIRSSYPDFILKDKQGRIHLFEVKSVNHSADKIIDSEEYKQKVRQLADCYKACSLKLHGYLFYLPVLKGDDWQITRFCDGKESLLTIAQFISSIESHNPH